MTTAIRELCQGILPLIEPPLRSYDVPRTPRSTKLRPKDVALIHLWAAGRQSWRHPTISGCLRQFDVAKRSSWRRRLQQIEAVFNSPVLAGNPRLRRKPKAAARNEPIFAAVERLGEAANLCRALQRFPHLDALDLDECADKIEELAYLLHLSDSYVPRKMTFLDAAPEVLAHFARFFRRVTRCRGLLHERLERFAIDYERSAHALSVAHGVADVGPTGPIPVSREAAAELISETDSTIDTLLDALQWMERISEVRWPRTANEKTRAIDAFSLNARRYIGAVAGGRPNEWSRTDPLSRDVWQSEVKWSEGSPRAQMRAAQLIEWFADRCGAQVRERAGASLAAKTALARTAAKMTLPFAEAMLRDTGLNKEFGEPAVLHRVGHMYVSAAWAQSGAAPETALELLRHLHSQRLYEKGIASMCLAACYCVHAQWTAAIKGVTKVGPEDINNDRLALSNHADPVQLWQLARPFLDCDHHNENDGQRVLATGIAAGFVLRLPPPQIEAARRLMFDLHGRWSVDEYTSTNAAWASMAALGAIFHFIRHCGRTSLVDEEADLMRRVVDASGDTLITALAKNANVVRVLSGLSNTGIRAHLSMRMTQALQADTDIHDALHVIAAVRTLDAGGDENTIHRIWSLMLATPPAIQLAWLRAIQFPDPTQWSKCALRHHAAAAILAGRSIDRHWHPEIRDAWYEAIFYLATVALAQQDEQLLSDMLEGLSRGNRVTDIGWLSAIRIAALGSGSLRLSETRQWARRALELRVIDGDTELETGILALAQKTLALELSGRDADLADQLLSRNIEPKNDSVHTTLWRQADRHLAHTLHARWQATQCDGLAPAFAHFERLATIEGRCRGSAIAKLQETAQWLDANGLTDDSRQTHIARLLDERIRPQKPPVVNGIAFEDAYEAALRRFEQAISDAEAPSENERRSRSIFQPASLIRAGLDEGPWQMLTDEEKSVLLPVIGTVDGLPVNADSSLVAGMSLPWLKEAGLVRVLDTTWRERRLVAYYIVCGGDIFRLTGASPPIHEVNSRAPIRLSEANVLDYLRFFGFCVRGEEGPYYIFESKDDPMVPSATDPATQSALAGAAGPAIYVGRSKAGNYVCNVAVFYSNALFAVTFEIQPNGMIEMVTDTPIAADLPVRIDEPLIRVRCFY